MFQQHHTWNHTESAQGIELELMFTSNIQIRGENVVLMALIRTRLLVPDETDLRISETFAWRRFPGLVFRSAAVKAHPPQGSTCYVFWDAFLLNTAVKSAYVSLPSAQSRFDHRSSAFSLSLSHQTLKNVLKNDQSLDAFLISAPLCANSKERSAC